MVDCTITNKRKPRLEVVKKLDPSSDSGTFDLQIDGVTKKVDATHNGTTGFVTVETGTHVVSEINGTTSPHSLSDYDTEITCDNGDGNTPLGGTSLTTAALDYGDKVTCTITNHRKARIKVVKKLDPATDNGTFNLQIDGVTKKVDATHNDDTGVVTVPNGSHSVGEVNGTNSPNSLSDYDTEISCDSSKGGNTGQTSHVFTVGYGDNVTCTITNHRKARIKVVKKLDPAADNGTFNLQIDGVTKKVDATHNDDTGFVSVPNGTRSVGEVNGTNSPNSLSDYDAAISCDSSKGGNSGPTSYSFSVSYGETVTCTITNHRKAQIKVVKKLDPATDNGTFNLQIDGTTKKENATHNEGTGFVNVANGTHSVGEVNGTSSPNTLGEYDTDIACDSSKGGNTGQTSHSFAVGYGDKVTCEITNHRKARISGVKFHDQNSDRSKAGEPGLGGWEIRAYKDANGNSTADVGELSATTTTGAGGDYSFLLKPGTYVICEVGQPSWAQTAPNPVTNTQCGNVSTAPGGYVLTVAYGSVVADKDFGNAGFGSGSTMTNSAFELVDNLDPWTISDFEILLDGKNVIVATNPGQFYYHQRATNSSGGSSSMQFDIQWPCQFQTQTTSGQPIHAYLQLPSDAPNTWRDWTPQSSNISWTNQPVSLCSKTTTAGPLGDGNITVNNIPAGAKVWVTVHLDYSLKKTTAPSNTFGNPPILYKPFQSTATMAGGSSYSSSQLLGRGKKVTVIYGRMTHKVGGGAMADVWLRLTQGSNTATAQSDGDGNYVIYDGQGCTLADGLAGGCTGASTSNWTFGNGNVSSKLEILGDGLSAAGSADVPDGQVQRARCSAGTRRSPRSPGCRATRSRSPRAPRTTATGSSDRRDRTHGRMDSSIRPCAFGRPCGHRRASCGSSMPPEIRHRRAVKATVLVSMAVFGALALLFGTLLKPADDLESCTAGLYEGRTRMRSSRPTWRRSRRSRCWSPGCRLSAARAAGLGAARLPRSRR